MKLLIVTNTDTNKINHIVDSFLSKKEISTKIIHQNISSKRYLISFVEKVFFKLKFPLDFEKFNKRVLEEVESFRPEIVFIIKGNLIKPKTLEKIKKIDAAIKLISWSLDDMYARHNRSIYYKRGLHLYDYIFTTKFYNLKELKEFNAKNIQFLYQAYSKKYHKPYSGCSNSNFKSDVLFIGTAEKERIDSLNYLAEHGVNIAVFGGAWDKIDRSLLNNNLHIHEFDLIGDDYAEALSCAKISLCFLRKINRDTHTSRSVEIPACKGFMIAERTEEHLKLFTENKEAVYFDNNEELLKKVKYYLKNAFERERIRDNGYIRCIESDYSYDDRVKEIIKKVGKQ